MIVQVVEQDFKEFIAQDDKETTSNDDITLVVLESKPENILEKKFSNYLSLLEKVETEIIDFLQKYSIQLMEIRLGLHEMLANAVEHGNQLKEDKQVHVEVAVTEEYTRLVIEDEGVGFNWEEKLTASLQDTGFQDRGRGIMITKELFDKVQYNKKGNKICLIKFREE